MPDLSTLADVGALRPSQCPSCLAVSPIDGPLLMHGHGARTRSGVLPGDDRAVIRTVAVRRYRCTACGATCTVHPVGVLPRFLYTLYAIVNAWRLAMPRPVGEGLDDAAVYARQGVDRLSVEGSRSGPQRWRSLARWARHIGTWWPGRAIAGSTWRQRVGSVLVGFAAEGDVTARALASHAACGAAM
jgi:hypothetical protein